jgi:hypothetical protein
MSSDSFSPSALIPPKTESMNIIQEQKPFLTFLKCAKEVMGNLSSDGPVVEHRAIGSNSLLCHARECIKGHEPKILLRTQREP